MLGPTRGFARVGVGQPLGGDTGGRILWSLWRRSSRPCGRFGGFGGRRILVDKGGGSYDTEAQDTNNQGEEMSQMSKHYGPIRRTERTRDHWEKKINNQEIPLYV